MLGQVEAVRQWTDRLADEVRGQKEAAYHAGLRITVLEEQVALLKRSTGPAVLGAASATAAASG